jgi:undecaprenyl-diphosphatase
MPRRSPLDLARALAAPESRILLITLGIVASLWVFLVVASLMATGGTQAFDEWVLLVLRRTDDPAVPIGPVWLQRVALGVTALGSFKVLSMIILAVAAYLWSARRVAMVALVLVTSFGGMFLNPVMKDWFARPRPTVVAPLAIVKSLSFPSGHAMSAAVVYLTLGALLARTTNRARLRVAYLGLALALTVLVGLTRL